MRGRIAASAAAALLALGCAEEFKPESFVESLRVLGVRSEPAELHPGGLAQLSALVVDPSAPTRENTLLWLSCDPDPYDLGRNACSDFESLSDPTRLFEAPDGGAPALPPGMRFAGFGDRAVYQPPAELFSVVPPDDRRRLSGSVAQVLLFAIAESPPEPTQEAVEALLERVREGQARSIVTLFRIRVTEQAPLNENPVVGEAFVDGRPIPNGAHVALRPREQATIEITAPASARESYEQILSEGSEARQERLIAALYATGGAFSDERLALFSDVRPVYTAPSGEDDDPLPPPGAGRMWIVLRDTRGGAAWRELPMHVCGEPVPAPALVELRPAEVPRSSATEVTLLGQQLEGVLDVYLGASALSGVSATAGGARATGTAPPLPPGEYPVRVRTRDCVEHDTGHSLRVR